MMRGTAPVARRAIGMATKAEMAANGHAIAKAPSQRRMKSGGRPRLMKVTSAVIRKAITADIMTGKMKRALPVIAMSFCPARVPRTGTRRKH